MNSLRRKSAHSAFHRFYRQVQSRGCIYCGLRATTIDHFVPLSVVHMLMACEGAVTGKFLIPSCGECNAIASDRLFPSVAAKRRFIHERLRKKYRKVLAMPDWRESEQEESGWSLRTSVAAGMAQKSVLLQRLAWRNTSVSTPVDIAKIRFGLLGRGQGGVRRAAA
jgi:hypothetical protein